MLSHWPMSKAQPTSKGSCSVLMYSMKKRVRNVPIRPIPNRMPGRRRAMSLL
jgi:hypothetical protein